MHELHSVIIRHLYVKMRNIILYIKLYLPLVGYQEYLCKPVSQQIEQVLRFIFCSFLSKTCYNTLYYTKKQIK